MSSPGDHSAGPPRASAQSATRVRASIWMAAAALLGFLAGFLLQRARVNGARDDLAQTTRALHAAQLEAVLGAAVIEAQSGRYETARQRASDFYTGLQRQLLPVIAGEQQEKTRTMLSERDSIITSLARSDPTSSGALASVLVRLRETLRRTPLDSIAVSDTPGR